MKITGEARLLLVMGLAVLLGGGAMVLVNKAPALAPARPTPPPPIKWSAKTFDPLVAQARHKRGDPKKARVTVVEFGDLECPSCRRAYNVLLTKLDHVIPMDFVFHHFPLPMHQEAMPAAIATEAAGLQGKFWPMFDALYTGEKTEMSTDFFTRTATSLGLDMTKYRADLADSSLAQSVQTDSELAQSLSISQTPTFVVRDEKTGNIYQAVGAADLDTLISKITGKPKLMPDAHS